MGLINKLTSNSNSLQNILGTLNSINIEAKHQSNLISQIKAGLQSDSTGGDSNNINLQSKTVTPTASDQMVICDSEYDALSSVTVNGDANLKAENIISGATIFGVEGRVEVGASEGLKWWEEGEIVGEQKTCDITFNLEETGLNSFNTIISKQTSSNSSEQISASYGTKKDMIYNDDYTQAVLTNVVTNSLIILDVKLSGNYFSMGENPDLIKIYEDVSLSDEHGVFVFYVTPNANNIDIYIHCHDEF